TFDPLHLMRHSTGAQKHWSARRTPDLSRTDNARRRNSGDAFGYFRGIAFYQVAHPIEVDSVLVDELLIDPATLDKYVQDSIRQRTVAPWPHRKEQICSARDRRHPRID